MRRFLAQLFAIAACLALPVGLVSAWLDLVVTDTEAYVKTVGPVADNAKVKKAASVWLEDFTITTIDAMSPIPVGDGLRGFIEPATATVVASPDFERIWRAANRTVHPQVMAVLDGRTRGVGTDDGRISLELGDLVNAVLTELAGGGAVPGLQVSPVTASIPIMDSQKLRDAQDAYSVADAAGLWVILGWAGAVVLALLLAPSKRAVLGTLAYGTILGLGVLAAGLYWVRDQVAESGLTTADSRLVSAVFDALVADLWKVMGGLLVVAAIVILGRLVIRRPASP